MNADKHRLAGHAIWVIGASSGIDAALDEELLARGARVAISARRKDKLDAVFARRMKIARLLPVRLWAAVSSRATKAKAGR